MYWKSDLPSAGGSSWSRPRQTWISSSLSMLFQTATGTCIYNKQTVWVGIQHTKCAGAKNPLRNITGRNAFAQDAEVSNSLNLHVHVLLGHRFAAICMKNGICHILCCAMLCCDSPAWRTCSAPSERSAVTSRPAVPDFARCCICAATWSAVGVLKFHW